MNRADQRLALAVHADFVAAVIDDQAFEHAEFELYFQPKQAMATARLAGFEALLRWNHPRRGHLPPGQFVPLLEDSGLIVQVGEWVVRAACGQYILTLNTDYAGELTFIRDLWGWRHAAEVVIASRYVPGSRDEAAVYSDDQGDAWDATPGAIDWLRRQAAARRPGKRRKR